VAAGGRTSIDVQIITNQLKAERAQKAKTITDHSESHHPPIPVCSSNNKQSQPARNASAFKFTRVVAEERKMLRSDRD
jgi:hypothetical protein